ncbi:MAG: hypothetical protein AMJ41_02160 [candidate division Zixibacteria bacterium DG_27]|nr:MAG: hypothetical protein AMJ41_02160 [candidate division Zixibacteria bacterium DG_27]
MKAFSHSLISCCLLGSILLATTDSIAQVECSDSVPSPLLPPSEVIAEDHPGDAGGAIIVRWKLSPDEAKRITGYEILRSTSPTGEFSSVGFAATGANRYVDANTEDSLTYYYKVVAVDVNKNASESELSPPARSSAQWFNFHLLNLLIIGGLICGAVIYFIAHAKKGKKLFLRRIAGLEAVDEAIGRATEMGRPILFIPGILDMDDVQTIAGITILGRVAKTIAQYETKLNVPTSRSIVMSTAMETVKEAYISAGRADAYSDDFVHYVTDEQFGYVAAVDGIMVRERPATCFYIGAFFAESLIMAETGNSIGAIQIAGTAMPAQLPFFVAACDYTLIGEELFAASAYLSGEPKQLGSLKGQDVGKIIAMSAIVIGAALETIFAISGSSLFGSLAELMHKLFSIVAG